MLDQKFILITSGFYIPYNSYYKSYSDDSSVINKLLGQRIYTNRDNKIIEFFKNNGVYSSSTINKLYSNYLSDKSFDSYVTLLDVTIDVVKDVDIKTFFMLQANNKYLSATGLVFCIDLITGEFLRNYNRYDILPATVRFTLDNGYTKETILKNQKEIEEKLKQHGVTSWKKFLTDLFVNKEAFSVFFKFLLVDYYRLGEI